MYSEGLQSWFDGGPLGAFFLKGLRMASFKPIVKSVMKCLLPEKAFQSFFAVRSRKWQLNSFKVSGALLQVERYIEEHGTVVQSGPFAGMIFPLKSAMNRWVIPKLTGSYESEIHFFLEALTKRNYDFILDIGSAEGYYACGLARLFRFQC
jgi:protein-L-isoaspartate O-methyltransferase